MKSFIKVIGVIGINFIAMHVNAATVAGYTFADDAFVDTLVSYNGNFLNYNSVTSADVISSAQLAADVTDGPPGGQYTYVLSVDSDASLELAFSGVNVYNGAGDDLALFFVGLDRHFSLDLAGTINSYTTVDTGYDVTDAWGTYALTVALIDLDDFGLAENSSLGNFDVLLGDPSRPALSMVAAFNSGMAPAPVPLPASVLLLITGLASLGLMGRRKA